jgi:CHAT domain-containing protein
MREAIDDFKTIQPSRGDVHRSEEKIAEASSALRALIWAPMEKQLTGVHRVYVAPDGQLSLIPFEALARKSASGDWQYLTEETELVYLGTGRDLSRLASTRAPSTAHVSETAVLIGNPDFNAAPEALAAMEAHISPREAVTVSARRPIAHSPSTLGVDGGDDTRLQIPRNWNQVAVLAALIQQASDQLQHYGWTVTKWTDQQAVKEWVESLEAPRILQFATHGYIMDRASNDPQGWDNPLLRSMLIMAGVNDWHPVYRVDDTFLPEATARARGLNDDQLRVARAELSDGVLTAYEVTGMHLQGTELVNMTACETGLGEVTPDGVAGLRQGFLLAGARSLTMSMWEVPAQETTQELGDFYENWLGNGSQQTQHEHRYEAFHAAQLAALNRAREHHGSGHPFYWAGTIFFGAPGDLPAVKRPSEVKQSTAKRSSKS